jgi:hypothetical protein
MVILILTLLVSMGTVVQQAAKVEQYDLKYLENFRDYCAREGSGVKVDANLRSADGVGLVLVVGALHVLFAPFPWQLGGGSLRMFLVYPETLVWTWLFFMAVLPGLWYCLRNRLQDILPLLVFIVGMTLMFSLMFSNIGLVYRQRAQLMPWLLILAAVGLELRAGRLPDGEARFASIASEPAGSPVGAPG